MKDFDSLINIWNDQQSAPKVDYKTVIDNYKKQQNAFSRKIWIELIFISLAMLVISFIWLDMSFSLWTTHISFLIIGLCCVFYFVNQISNLKTLSNGSLFETPDKHIEHIKNFRQSRYTQNTRNYYIYAAGLGIAILLYFIELLNYIDKSVAIPVLLFVVVWFALTSFVIRKIYIKKEEKSFKEMLEELKRLKRQLDT